MSEWWVVAPGWIATIAIAVAIMKFRSDRQKRRAELERESRDQATRLAAWVLVGDGGQRARGITINNASGGFFHKIYITVRWGSSLVPSLDLALLPPGEFFVPLVNEAGTWRWGYARHSSPGEVLKPMLKTNEFQVTVVTFSDRLGRTWRIDDRGVLASS